MASSGVAALNFLNLHVAVIDVPHANKTSEQRKQAEGDRENWSSAE